MVTTSHPINRITRLNNHITTFSSQRANMSSQTNNDQFKLENLFNVKVSSSVQLNFDQC
jgi:response regulator of citrate/malate metabolism